MARRPVRRIGAGPGGAPCSDRRPGQFPDLNPARVSKGARLLWGRSRATRLWRWGSMGGERLPSWPLLRADPERGFGVGRGTLPLADAGRFRNPCQRRRKNQPIGGAKVYHCRSQIRAPCRARSTGRFVQFGLVSGVGAMPRPWSCGPGSGRGGSCRHSSRGYGRGGSACRAGRPSDARSRRFRSIRRRAGLR